MEDKLWVGDSEVSLLGGNKYAINFEFGCMFSSGGLFRDQLADGIMGMSLSSATLPCQLQAHKVVENRIFALCFRNGGGIMTLGGVDQSIHTQNTTIQYAKMTPSSDWFGVTVLNVSMKSCVKNNTVEGGEMIRDRVHLNIDVNSAFNNRHKNKGTIVDSGTTDTYLPEVIGTEFARVFKEISGVAYSGSAVKLSKEQYDQLPTIVFTLQGVRENTPIEVSLSALLSILLC
jgi:hypothetical protein